MPRQGLTRKDVLRACFQLIDDKGFAGFSMNELAKRLNIRPASLYNHIENEASLLFRIGQTATERLTSALTAAIEGKEGREAFFALAGAWHAFATEHPGLYAVAMKTPEREDVWREPPFFAPVDALTGGDLTARDLILASLHGAVTLETAKVFSPDEDADARFQGIINTIADRFWKDGPAEGSTR